MENEWCPIFPERIIFDPGTNEIRSNPPLMLAKLSSNPCDFAGSYIFPFLPPPSPLQPSFSPCTCVCHTFVKNEVIQFPHIQRSRANGCARLNSKIFDVALPAKISSKNHGTNFWSLVQGVTDTKKNRIVYVGTKFEFIIIFLEGGGYI